MNSATSQPHSSKDDLSVSNNCSNYNYASAAMSSTSGQSTTPSTAIECSNISQVNYYNVCYTELQNINCPSTSAYSTQSDFEKEVLKDLKCLR